MERVPKLPCKHQPVSTELSNMGTSNNKNCEELRQPQKFFLVGLRLIAVGIRRARLPSSLHTFVRGEYFQVKRHAKNSDKTQSRGPRHMTASNRGRRSGPLASVLKSPHPSRDKQQAGKWLFLSDASASLLSSLI